MVRARRVAGLGGQRRPGVPLPWGRPRPVPQPGIPARGKGRPGMVGPGWSARPALSAAPPGLSLRGWRPCLPSRPGVPGLASSRAICPAAHSRLPARRLIPGLPARQSFPPAGPAAHSGLPARQSFPPAGPAAHSGLPARQSFPPGGPAAHSGLPARPLIPACRPASHSRRAARPLIPACQPASHSPRAARPLIRPPGRPGGVLGRRRVPPLRDGRRGHASRQAPRGPGPRARPPAGQASRRPEFSVPNGEGAAGCPLAMSNNA